METCEYCGRLIGVDNKKYWLYCDGVLVLGTDPYAEEIAGDTTEVWMCDGQRMDSADDI